MTMGKAQKLRAYRKEARGMYRDVVEAMADRDRKFLKPKPSWVPYPIWLRLLSIFVWVRK